MFDDLYYKCLGKWLGITEVIHSWWFKKTQEWDALKYSFKVGRLHRFCSECLGSGVKVKYGEDGPCPLCLREDFVSPGYIPVTWYDVRRFFHLD